MADRKLINVHHHAGIPMDGQCSNCIWEKMTHLDAQRGPEKAASEFMAEFEAHDCSKYPKRKAAKE